MVGLSSGQSGKVALNPQATQVVTQPAGTDLEVNRLNGALYASQYATGGANNGISNAAASPDCGNGCDIRAEQTYTAPAGSTPETVGTSTLPNGTQLEDRRDGIVRESHNNPLNVQNPGNDAGHTIDVVSTETADAIRAATGATQQFSTGLAISNEALAGGSNVYPKALQTGEPYGKSTFSALNLQGSNYTLGQHILAPFLQNCYGVGDCLMGSLEMNSSGGFRDDADEGAHPFDFIIAEDTLVFQGTCTTGCATGATQIAVSATAAAGTEGEGRYLLDTNAAKTITNGVVVGGGQNGQATVAEFSGTNFPVSVFLQTAVTVPTQANSIAPGTVTVPINTGGVPAGYQTNTAALPSAAGVFCVLDPPGNGVQNFETAAYTVVDGSHVSATFKRPHNTGATLAAGGLCGYGLEQTADTFGNIRQIFPVVGSSSATELYYAGANTPLVGISNSESAYVNYNQVIYSMTRTNGVVTVNELEGTQGDVNGLTATISGAADPSFNGTFVVTTTGQQTFTYQQAGANSSTTGGTAQFLKGGYVLYPMAEVVSVYDAVGKSIDGALTLAANTVPWAANDTVEQPHYYQQRVAADVENIYQFTPRPPQVQTAGITYSGNNGPGLFGYVVTNGADASQYYGNGGTHTKPNSALGVSGVWDNSVEVEAGESSVLRVHCNSHTCSRWNSGYDLFNLDTATGVDRVHYEPGTSGLTMILAGTQYQFTPQALTAGTINVTTLNAGTINGQFTGQFAGKIAAGSVPVFGASGAGHAAGAVPDPGATAGTTRFLREDGSWTAAGGATQVSSLSGYATTGPVNFPERGKLLGEYLLTEGAGLLAHDTSGQGNDGTLGGINGGPVWEGAADLNFPTAGAFIQLPTAVNSAQAWQFAIYAPPFGANAGPLAPGYGSPTGYPGNPSILCGTDTQHLCLIAGTNGKSMQFQAYTTDNTQAVEPLSAGWHIVTLLCGSNVNGVVTKTHLLYDGAEVGAYVQQGDAGTCGNPTTGNYQIGGSSVLSSTFFMGKLAAAWAWKGQLTLADGVAAAKSALDYLKSKGVQTEFRKAGQTAPVILAGLDSRTYGIQLTTATAWPLAMQLNDASFARVNLGISGADTYDSCAMFDLMYGAQLGTDSGPAIVMLWGGVNDFLFTSQTTRQIADNLRCMVQKAKAAGARVVLATEVSAVSNAPGQGLSQGDAGKDALNPILRNEAFSWGVDELADLATDPHLGADGASANQSCFPDTLHPGPNCEPYITAIMQNAVNELTGSTERMRSATAAASYQELAADRYLDLTGTVAQTVTLPDCTGYSLPRQVLNVGAVSATVAAVNGQTLTGSGALAAGARAVFEPIPGPLATAGCRWERVQ